MSKEISHNKQGPPPANKQAQPAAEPKVWRLASPQGRKYATSDPVEAHHLMNTRGYKEVGA